MDKKPLSLGRKLMLWFGSFLVIGTCLAYYFNMPLNVLLPAGVMTLVVTLARHFLIKPKA